MEGRGTDNESRVFFVSLVKMNCGNYIEFRGSNDIMRFTARTLWSVSQIFPIALSFLTPPEPPAGAFPDGGALGIMRDNSTPESTVVMVTSAGSGTGERFGVSMVQLRAMVTVESEWE